MKAYSFFVVLFCFSCMGIFSPPAAASGSLHADPTHSPSKQDTVLVPFSSVFTEVFEDATDEASQIADSNTTGSKVLQLEGLIEKIEGGAFRHVTLKNKQGETLRLLWYQETANSNQNHWALNTKDWQQKHVRVVYQTIDCYLPKQGQYTTLLKITEIQLLPARD